MIKNYFTLESVVTISSSSMRRRNVLLPIASHIRGSQQGKGHRGEIAAANLL
jgi:hypothetical protein